MFVSAAKVKAWRSSRRFVEEDGTAVKTCQSCPGKFILAIGLRECRISDGDIEH